ncbi:MAG: hypothetical protein JW708_11730 [Vallitaleaceae bacterium]|nr:hypothetical protein [Vallitaleaceae bacterium]
MNKRGKKIALSMLLVLFLLLIFVFSPLYPVAKSYVVMGIYSNIHKSGSFLEEIGVEIQIPGGLTTWEKDYYPFVITYDSSEDYSKEIKEDIDLVIYYNFPSMDLSYGASVLYREDSPLYCSFYGAYALRYPNEEKIYGLNDAGEADFQAIMEVTQFDFEELVLKSVGAINPSVVYELMPVNRKISFDQKEFLVFDAKLETEGLWHQVGQEYLAYLQYGKPSPQMGEGASFKRIPMYGRIYMYVDEDKKISYFYYILATSLEQVNKVEKDFILKSKIKDESRSNQGRN